MLVGVTGKSCAGKDFLCAILKGQGYCELNLDSMGHLALQHKQEAVCQAFPELKNAQKTIDRKKLGDLVFHKQSALHKLEAILHPYMKELVLEELKNFGHTSHIVLGEHTMNRYSKLILNAAILEKLGLLSLCDLVLWVQAPLWLRAWRAREREKITWHKFLRREWVQRKLQMPSGISKVYPITNNKIHKENAQNHIFLQLKQIPQLGLENKL